jgi:hypothetical protein
LIHIAERRAVKMRGLNFLALLAVFFKTEQNPVAERILRAQPLNE